LRGPPRGSFDRLGLRDRQRSRRGRSVLCQDYLRLSVFLAEFTNSYDFAFGKSRRLVCQLQLYIVSRGWGFPDRLVCHIDLKNVYKYASAAVPKFESLWLFSRKKITRPWERFHMRSYLTSFSSPSRQLSSLPYHLCLGLHKYGITAGRGPFKLVASDMYRAGSQLPLWGRLGIAALRGVKHPWLLVGFVDLGGRFCRGLSKLFKELSHMFSRNPSRRRRSCERA